MQPQTYPKRSFQSLFLLCLPILCLCQPVHPPATGVFTNVLVSRIEILIHPDSLAALLHPQNLQSDHEYPADFIWSDGTTTDTVRQVGFRLRGNTSRNSAKKSFKVKFNHFTSSKYQGLSDMNLNGEHNDPTLMRAKLSWELMRLAGLEAPRANYVALYINKEYKGLYINVEHIDNDYFEARKKDPNGQIFKCFYGCDFRYAGDSPSAYSETVYSPENNKESPDYTPFIAFCKALNAPIDTNYRCALEKVFDVDAYLRRMAMEILLGHWDNPIFNKNNAYLYIHPETKKVELLSYDIDNTFGIDWFNVNWADRNIYSWSPSSQPRPIYTQLLKVPEYKVRFSYYIKMFCSTFFQNVTLSPLIQQLKEQISPFRVGDVYASYDYGYTYDDFLRSFDVALGAHAKFGLTEYIGRRAASALSQLQNTQISPVIEHVRTENAPNALIIEYSITSLSPVSSYLDVHIAGSIWSRISGADDGISPDRVASDGVYTTKVPLVGQQSVEFVINASDASSRTSRWPVCGTYLTTAGYETVPALRINEWMADNTSIQDETGEFDDWIEIHNASPQSVNLENRFLTDNPENPDKWALPPITMEPGQFLLIWADEDQNQGSLHANFKLSKSGEFIGIYDSEKNSFAPIDTLTFGPMAAGVSFGRLPDGQGTYRLLSILSPGASNGISGTGPTNVQTPGVYPNPCSSDCSISGLQYGDVLKIVREDGQIIQQIHISVNGQIKLEATDWPAGIYWLMIKRGTVILSRKIIRQ